MTPPRLPLTLAILLNLLLAITLAALYSPMHPLLLLTPAQIPFVNDTPSL